MHIILGGTGHVGSAAARTLLSVGEAVTIVTHDPAKAGVWEARGATVAVADIGNPDAIRKVLRTGRRAFLLNPPAPVSTDTDAVEHKAVAAILAALQDSRLEKLVAQSTYGAQPGERCGDLNVLYDFEQGLERQPIPAAINRAAYYFSNWDISLAGAREDGVIQTMLGADTAFPMVAPEDLGRIAAQRLMSPVGDAGIRYIEGPRRYSPRDVAHAFAVALNRDVRVETIPRDQWMPSFRAQGFSPAAAESYAKMTAASVDGGFLMPDDPVRGTVTLENYIAALVQNARVDA